MLENLIAAKAVVAGVWFAALFVAERLARAATPPASGARLRRNIGLWLLILILSPLIVAPLTAWGANHLVWQRPDWMLSGSAALLILAVDLILLDIWTYWLHRAYHRAPFLWRLHEVHHRDEFLDTTSAVRFHIGEVVLSALLRLIPIALLATQLSTILIFEALLLCTTIFHHSNVRLPAKTEALLSRFIVTPSIHWVHHHAVRRDTNSNYASVLSIWDPLFGSRSPTKRSHDMKIGVEGVEDMDFFQLLLMPLRKRGE